MISEKGEVCHPHPLSALQGVPPLPPPPTPLPQDENAFRVLQAIDRHFSPKESMIRQASTDVEELERIIVEESKKRVRNRDDLAMEAN